VTQNVLHHLVEKSVNCEFILHYVTNVSDFFFPNNCDISDLNYVFKTTLNHDCWLDCMFKAYKVYCYFTVPLFVMDPKILDFLKVSVFKLIGCHKQLHAILSDKVLCFAFIF